MTYSNTLISACDKDKQPKRTLDSGNALAVPDDITYDALISACDKAQG